MPLGFLVGGCCLGGVLLPLEDFGFPFAEADDASALFTSVFLLAIDSDPGRSVPHWSFYAKSEDEVSASGLSLSTTLVRSAIYAPAGAFTPTSANSSSDSSHSVCVCHSICAWKTWPNCRATRSAAVWSVRSAAGVEVGLSSSRDRKSVV